MRREVIQEAFPVQINTTLSRFKIELVIDYGGCLALEAMHLLSPQKPNERFIEGDYDRLSSDAVPVVEFVTRMNGVSREDRFHFFCRSLTAGQPMNCATAADQRRKSI